jgi:hypothetical protein
MACRLHPAASVSFEVDQLDLLGVLSKASDESEARLLWRQVRGLAHTERLGVMPMDIEAP